MWSELNWVVKLHSRKCSLGGSKYIRPEFLAGKAKTQRSCKCQVYDTAVAGDCISQANKIARVLRETNAVEKYSTIMMTAQNSAGMEK